MLQILLASHGQLAKGMKNSVEMIMGKSSNITTICGYVNQRVDIEVMIRKTLSEFLSSDKVVVVTDLFGGSINNIFLSLLNDFDFFLISGMNLGLIIQLMLMKSTEISETSLQKVIEESKSRITYCNKIPNNSINTGEF